MRNSFKTPLIVEVMPSGKRFKLHFQFTYWWKRQYLEICVPAGFVTDFASIPRVARILISKLGRYNKAAVIHDYVYQTHTIRRANGVVFCFDRSMADQCFQDGMRDLGVAKWKYTLMYLAVRIGGWAAW